MGIFPEGVLFNVLFSGFRAPATFPRVGMLQDRPDIHSQIVLPSTAPTLGEKTRPDEPLPLTFDPSVPADQVERGRGRCSLKQRRNPANTLLIYYQHVDT